MTRWNGGVVSVLREVFLLKKLSNVEAVSSPRDANGEPIRSMTMSRR